MIHRKFFFHINIDVYLILLYSDLFTKVRRERIFISSPFWNIFQYWLVKYHEMVPLYDEDFYTNIYISRKLND